MNSAMEMLKRRLASLGEKELAEIRGRPAREKESSMLSQQTVHKRARCKIARWDQLVRELLKLLDCGRFNTARKFARKLIRIRETNYICELPGPTNLCNGRSWDGERGLPTLNQWDVQHNLAVAMRYFLKTSNEKNRGYLRANCACYLRIRKLPLA
jgi:hypothetical protein